MFFYKLKIKFTYPRFFLLLILLIGFLLRFIFLSEIPPGIANDEANIILNAISFSQIGENIPGVVTGIIGTPTGDYRTGIHSEISSYLLIPSFFIFGSNWPLIKMPFIILSLGIIFLSYLLAKKITNTNIALLVALLSAINPWSIMFGRSAYESIISCFFYLLAFYIVISLRGWKILYSFPIFLMGFASYFSAKTLFLPLILFCIPVTKLFYPTKSLKPVIVLNILAFLFLAIYLPILYNNPAGVRFNELKSTEIQNIVNLKRTASINYSFANIFENKYSEELRIRLKAYIGGISPDFLFLNGEVWGIPTISLPDHGPMYLIDSLLILLGIIYLTKTYPKALFFLFGLILISLIPNFLNLQGTTYMIRTVILFPILITLSACGVYYLIQNPVKNKLFAIFSVVLVVFIYLFLFGNFVFQYYSRMPIDRSGPWFFHQRLLAQYINLSSQTPENPTIIISTPEPKNTFFKLLLFTNSYRNSLQIRSINQNLKNKIYQLNQVIVTDKCPDINQNKQAIIFYDSATSDCAHSKDDSIASIRDGGTNYYITNDLLCTNVKKQRYPLIKNINDLDITNLTKEGFCQKFIVNPFK